MTALLVLVFVTSMLATVVLLMLLDLRPCGVEYGTLVRCRALVGRRGHDFHVWEPIPIEEPIRAWTEADELRERNRRALMIEQRIAFSVMDPKRFVIGGIS